ncbi:MAG: RNA-binding protein [Beijerinckiaceae bacterium]
MRNEDEEKGPTRTCAATRMARPMDELIRFVLDPAGVLTPDIRARLPGRGVWVSASREAVIDAQKRKCFARSLKQPAIVPADLPDLVDQLLEADARQSLAMANKAGLVTCGFAKVESALAKRNVAVVVSASDGSEDGKRKIQQAITRSYGHAAGVPLVSPLASSEMNLALGRENAIHAALQAGPACDSFMSRCRRLLKYRLEPLAETRPDADETSASPGPLVLGGQ